MDLLTISDQLLLPLGALRFGPPVAYVYQPLDYAGAGWRRYLTRYGAVDAPGRCLLVGMNPGPWGMAQTGVPFGAVERVRGWLGIETPVSKPEREHPRKPVLGFDCHRREVSGDRLWGWAERAFGTPERFFGSFFVWNYCPLLFLDEGGRNLTPDRLRAEDRDRILEPCDRALRRAVETLEAGRVVGIGAFAERRARTALDGFGLEITRVLHPSPASPAANRGWEEAVEAQLREAGVELP